MTQGSPCIPEAAELLGALIPVTGLAALIPRARVLRARARARHTGSAAPAHDPARESILHRARWARMRAATASSVMNRMMRTAPPQRAHASP